MKDERYYYNLSIQLRELLRHKETECQGYEDILNMRREEHSLPPAAHWLLSKLHRQSEMLTTLQAKVEKYKAEEKRLRDLIHAKTMRRFLGALDARRKK